MQHYKPFSCFPRHIVEDKYNYFPLLIDFKQMSNTIMLSDFHHTLLNITQYHRNWKTGIGRTLTDTNFRSESGLPGVYKCGSVTNSFSGTPLTTFMDATELERISLNCHLLSHVSGPVTYLSSKGMRH